MKRLLKLLHSSGVVISLATLLCSMAGAQVSTGTILGTVTDSSGAAIPGASVTIKNIHTGQEREVTTSAVGDYTVPDLTAGHYSITTVHTGFRTAIILDFELQVAQTASVNPVLQVGQLTEQVIVAASLSPLLVTSTSSVGQVIDTGAVTAMPLNGRDFWQLTQLTPGVSYTPGGQNIPAGGASIRASVVNVSVNGHSSIYTGWYLDGANITELQLGGTIISPNVDSLQEFKVEGSNMSAQYGHTPTVINATLKSGSDHFHGVLYEFFRNNALDAKNYFFTPPPGTDERDEPLHRNQFGGVLGGPIRREKTFFFVDLESTLLSEGEVNDNIVPSALERQGNFSQSSEIISNPLTGQPFQGNIIPTSLISPQATYLLPYMPLPTQVSGSTYSAINTNPLMQALTKGDIKIDEQLSPKDHIMGRYSIANNLETDPNPYPAMGTFPLESRGQDIVVNWVHIFSPKWINLIQASYYRSLFTFAASLSNQDINSQAGILGFEGLAPAGKQGAPTISIANYSTFEGSSTNQDPKQNRIRMPEYVDQLSFSSGKHDVNFGADIQHLTYMADNSFDADGSFTFNGDFSGNNFVDFLLGYPEQGIRSNVIGLYGVVGTNQAYYVQDDYRVKPTLTLNLGLRWEVSPFYRGNKGQLSAFDQQTGDLVIPSDFSMNAQPGTSTLYPLFQDRIELTSQLKLPQSIGSTAKNDFAPRLGFAWTPGKDWSIRGAYGIYYSYLDAGDSAATSVHSVPFISSQTTVNTKVGPTPQLTLGNFFGNTPIVSANPNPGQPCSFGLVLDSCTTPNAEVEPLYGARHPYTDEWNLSVQRQFGSRIVLDVAYVGNDSFHGLRDLSLNDPPPGVGAVQARRPFLQWGTITQYTEDASANYNALQTKFEARAWHGATFLMSYTHGKCHDNGEDNGSSIEEPSESIRYYGDCTFDITNNLVGSFDYQLPFGKERAIGSHLPAWENAIMGGWNASGILTLQSGLPFTPQISTDTANTGVADQRPNVVGKPIVLKNPSCWFYISANPSCVALDPNGVNAYSVPAQYTYGNGGVNDLRADGWNGFDFAMKKLFPLSNERSIEFRTEFFNIFNKTTFAAPGTSINTSSGAKVTSTLDASRQIEFALKAFF